MRYSRQNKIIELINDCEVDTQETLVDLLNQSGFKVTQATISRDIKELKLIKTLTASGKYKYVIGQAPEASSSERFIKIFKESVLSIKNSGNIIVIKTLSGCGPAAGEAIDTSNLPSIIGTISGDNTILLVIDSTESVPELVEEFNSMLK